MNARPYHRPATAADLLTTARGTLVAATRPDDLAAATAYAAVAQAEALARIADAIDAALCVLKRATGGLR